MKYILSIMIAGLGFICIFKPELIVNQNSFNATICFALASVLMNYKKEDK